MVTLRAALATHLAGRRFVIENPTQSYLWKLDEARELLGREGVVQVDVSNCMFEGGVRNKRTTLVTNFADLVGALGGKTCSGKNLCDRTGLRHDTWTPTVKDGVVVDYPTAAEASYPRGLRELVATTVANYMEQGDRKFKEGDALFTEVFAGLDASLSEAVSRALWTKAPSPSSSASS